MKLKLSFFVAFLLGFVFSASSAEMAKPVSSFTDSMHIKAALQEFKDLPAKERRYRLKEAKKAIREYKAAKRKNADDADVHTLLLVILALILPPLAVYLHQGEANNKFWITTLLFVLGLLGAFTIGWYLILASIIYALIVILGAA